MCDVKGCIALQHTHAEVGGQLRGVGSSTFLCIPGIALGSSGLQSKYPCPLSHPISSRETVLEADIFLPNTKQKGLISDSQG